jgi:ribosomal protein S18 acetylase RimI-like enzyme
VTGLYQIETASWHDLNPLRQIEKECFGEDAWPLWDLIAVLTFPNVVRLKAVVDGHMVGFAGGDPKPSDGVGWITTLGVLPAYRRQGIARALLTACEDQLNQPRISLSVRRSNQAAIELYQSAGYHQTGVWPRYYIGGEDALVLEKER